MITNQIALYYLDNEANVAKTLPVNYKTGTFSSRDLEKFGFGIIPTRCSYLRLKRICLVNMISAILIILTIHIIIAIRWMFIKILSVVINGREWFKVIVPGGCCLDINIIRKMDL